MRSDKTDSRGARWLAALCLMALSAGATAATQWYTVELIVFERLDSDGLYTERWPLDPGSIELGGAIELRQAGAADAASTGGPRPFQRLRRDELELRETWTRFRRSRGFRPLLHVGWRQPGYTRRQARAARIGTSREPRREATSTAFATVVEPDTVEGTVRLYRSRYLHVEADLLYYRPEARTVLGAVGTGSGSIDSVAAPTLFRLTTSRRLRSRELHYLDHPLYGVIVQVTPYALAAPAPAEAQSEAPETATTPEERAPATQQ